MNLSGLNGPVRAGGALTRLDLLVIAAGLVAGTLVGLATGIALTLAAVRATGEAMRHNTEGA